MVSAPTIHFFRRLSNGICNNSFSVRLSNGICTNNSFSVRLSNGICTNNSFSVRLSNGICTNNSFCPAISFTTKSIELLFNKFRGLATPALKDSTVSKRIRELGNTSKVHN
ncbi:hypothetical protein CEXT_156011 [Caerostris extrusa]|uniref:Uncharacterized protein n=1 Tax=Caerostris extrusa TaxID=172846 RepID=A0AAV4QFF5_CAEEX|nr:hypothetical protein CEXT_156011 [Caerostris extrusa]